MGFRIFLLLSFCTLTWTTAVGQNDPDTELILPNYNVTSDDPYDINKLYLHFQPFYAEISDLNITGGFGIEANYYHKNTFDLSFAGRSTYGKRFDINRYSALKNGVNEVKPTPYYYVDLGFTFHAMDRAKGITNNVTLFDGSMSRSEWASAVPYKIGVESDVREILGVRVGVSYSSTTIDLSRTLEVQGNAITTNDGTPIVADNLYTNLSMMLINVGVSMSWFHNLQVEFDAPWTASGDDLLLTPYIDFLYAPYISIESLMLQGLSVEANNVNTNPYGFRAGVMGKFDRKIGWGYGAEVGLKPGIQQRGFFFTVKMSFPVFGLKLTKPEDTNGNTDD